MARSRNYAERVNVLKKVQLNGSWKFVPVLERKGKIIRDHVLVAGRDEHHPEGSYYIEWYENSQRRKRCVGDFDEVLQAARQKSIELKARQAGIAIPDPNPARPAHPSYKPASVLDNSHPGKEGDLLLTSAPGGLAKDAAINDYLRYIQANRSEGTYKAYRYTLDVLLRASYSRASIREATRDDVLKFIAFCAERGYESRTIYDKLVVVLQFFKQNGVTHLINPSDWPKYVETIRPIYEPEEIRALLAQASEDEGLRVKFFLSSGFRDREVRYATFYDVDLRHSLVRVTEKPRWGFRPKNYEERAVPLPTALVEQLQKSREQRHASLSDLVFPNGRGKPKADHLDMVKKIAHRAGLNCGQCVTEHGNKCSEGPHCMRFFLHKFRHTYATGHLRDGVDIRTLQAWLGHRDIQSTMVYTKAVQSTAAVAKVNAGFLAEYVNSSLSGVLKAVV